MQNTSTALPSSHSTVGGNNLHRTCSKYEKRAVGVTESQVKY